MNESYLGDVDEIEVLRSFPAPEMTAQADINVRQKILSGLEVRGGISEDPSILDRLANFGRRVTEIAWMVAEDILR